MAGEDHITSSVGYSIIEVGGHVVQELVNIGRCVFYGCGLLGAYLYEADEYFIFHRSCIL